MIKDSREKEFLTKQEWGTKTSSTKQTRTWPTLRNPRVVRVSQTFGGKDRHSKVSTIRGLRDRRVRLSVPTAIQLYDLQDKLGLNQPSKVVDWLLNVSQHEIDKLPPLPLFQFHQSLASSSPAVDEEIHENAQTFVNDPLFCTNNLQKYGGKYDDEEIDSNTANYTFLHQFDQPNLSQEEVGHGFLLASGAQAMMPSAFSLYGNNHNNFQMPTTFAQLLPLSSSRTSLQAGREHERKQ